MERKINTPKWVRGLSVYEVNLRQYTKEGTIRAFEDHLPRLKDLGVGILWFMPVQPIGKKNRKGTLGSYYSISNYIEVNPEFGALEDFKSLVQKIHKLGMKVIIDWVANHTSWDHHWTKDHPGFYTKDENGHFKAPVEDWEDVIHLDYGNPDLWDEMINQMSFWLKETDIDGFRCDMAHLVPTLFWNRARRDLDRIKPVYMLAESQNHDLLEYAFDTIYNWKLLHAFNELANNKINAKELLDIAINELKYIPAGASQINFTSNHDENSWQGSAIERLHYYFEPLTVLTFLLPGLPLIYSGQEAGNHCRLKFFDKDEIEWKEDKMFGLFKILAGSIRTSKLDSNESLIRIIMNDHPEEILSFERQEEYARYLVFLNLSDKIQKFYIKCGDYNGTYSDLIQTKKVSFSCQYPLSIEPYQYHILFQKNQL